MTPGSSSGKFTNLPLALVLTRVYRFIFGKIIFSYCNNSECYIFLCPDSIFAVYFSIQNFDMPGDEISRLIHVIFNKVNFVKWSQAIRSYLKGHKLWLYVSGDRPIPEQVDK